MCAKFIIGKTLQNFNTDHPSEKKFVVGKTIQDFNSQQQEPGNLRKAGEFGLGLATRASQGAVSPVDIGISTLNKLGNASRESSNQLFGKPGRQFLNRPTNEEPVSIGQNIEKTVKNKFGEKSIEPENWMSEAAQLTAGGLPLFALGGGLAGGGLKAAGNVAADLAGSAASVGAKELGLGQIGQIVSGALGARGFKKAAGMFKHELKNPKVIKEYKNKLYTDEAELGKNVKVPVKELREEFESIQDRLHNQYPNLNDATDKVKKLKEIAKITQRKLNKPTMTAAELSQIERDLNAVYQKPGTVAGNYVHDMLSAVRDKLGSAADKHGNKNWGRAWKESKELHAIDKWQLGFQDWWDGLAEGKRINKVLGKLGRGAAAMIGGIPLAADVAVENFGAKPVMFINALRKTKEGQKVLWDIVAQSAAHEGSALNKSMIKFNNLADKFDKENI